MVAFLLNPGGRKRRRKGKSRSRKSRGHRRSYRRRKMSKARRSTRARSAARRRSYRKWRLASGSLFKRALGGMACSKAGRKRFYSMARSCSTRRPSASVGDLKSASELGYRSVANNGGRRSRRRNGHRRSRRSHRRNPWVPTFAMNPAMSTVMKGFNPSTLMEAVPVGVGFIGNMAAAQFVSGYMPSMLQSGPGNLVVSAMTSGLLGALVALVTPRYAKSVFYGGLTNTVYTAIRMYLLPAAGRLKAGIGDYITRADVSAAHPLGCYGGCGNGMGQLVNQSYRDANWGTNDNWNAMSAANPFTLGPTFTAGITPEELDPQLEYAENTRYGVLGDYATRADVAAARPLGYLGHTGNDYAIEGTATDELSGD
jgi:hypothetical protein